MKIAERSMYRNYVHDIDIDRFEEAIEFAPERQGSNKHGEIEDIGQCPDLWSLHKNGDTTGKFAINRDKRVYNCFVCGGGNLLDLAMAVRKIEEQEAEEWLIQFAVATAQTDTSFLSEIEEILRVEQREKPIMPYYNEHVLERWDNLPRIEAWLRGRGISVEVAQKARVGFQGDAMRLAPIRQGKPREEPYTGPCVYFPHYWGERLVGWQQRWLQDGRPKWIPKYTNTSGFPRTETLYNYENIYLAEQPIIVCESVPTVLFLWSLGYAAVATFGSNVSDEQMRHLRRFQQGVILAPDNDQPGRKWHGYTDDELFYGSAKRIERVILAEYLAHYVPVQVIEPVGEYNSGNDLGDLLDESPRFAAEAVKMLVEDAEYYR